MMASIPAQEVVSIAGFFLDLGKLMMQSKTLCESYLLTCNLGDMHQAVRCVREVLDLVYPEVSSLPTILIKVVPEDLLHMIPIILYHLVRSLLHKYEHTGQVEYITNAMVLFRCAYYQHSAKKYDYIVAHKLFVYLSTFHSQLKDIVSQAGFSLDIGGTLDFFKYICRNLTVDDEMFDLHNLGEDEEIFDYFLATTYHLNGGLCAEEISLKNINSGIQLCRQALKLFSSNRAKKGFILSELGFNLLKRSVKNGTLEDINEALPCCCDSLQLISRTASTFVLNIFNLSNACLHRFDMLGRRDDLDNGIRYANEAKKVVDAHTLEAAVPTMMTVFCLEIQVHVMFRLYEISGDINDLNATIHALSRAVNINARELDRHLLESEKSPSIFDEGIQRNQARLLYNLAMFLEARIQRTGRSEDMREAIMAAQKAVDLSMPNDSMRIAYLGVLSNIEFGQFRHFDDVKFLLQGIRHFREALSILEAQQQPGPGYTTVVNLVHSFICCTYLCLCRLGPEHGELLDNTMATCRKSLFSINTHHPRMIATFYTFCSCLRQRWEQTPNEIQYINEAVTVARLMIERTKEKADESAANVDELVVKADHIVMARNSLGSSLYGRYKGTGDVENRQEALDVVLKGFQILGASTALRMEAGQLAIIILSDLAEWDTACKLIQEVLDLLVILNGRFLDWQDKQLWLLIFSRHAISYASIALEARSDVWDVVEMLERCRGSVLGHLIDNQTDLNDLAEAAPEEAQRLRTLINETKLNTMIDSFGSRNMYTRVKQATRRIEAEGKIRDSLQKIRTMEGFNRFMLGPTKRELQAAAGRGPIVIVNISSIRSDALIITKDDSVLLPLPELKYEKVKEYVDANLSDFSDIIEKGQKNKKYQGLQKWLWNTCVKFIFEKLGDLGYGLTKFHVWWVGIGIASSLPFHAAGIYTGDVSETALSRAISSYAPTIKVLVHAMQKPKGSPLVLDRKVLTSKAETVQVKEPRLAIIVMPSTPGMDDLKGVQHEAEEVQKIVQDTYSTQILLQPSVKDAKMHIEECEIVHFACHGMSTLPDPSKSHLLLQATIPDSTMPIIDELTIRDVVAANLSHAKLAFLSSCSTAQDKFAGQWDEGLHLASGFQVVGYLHTIGNLWQSDDEVSVQLVKEFYRHLLAAGDFGDGDNVAKALNEALTSVAGKYAKQPLSWAQFVHFGI